MENTIYTKLVNKKWINKDGGELTFHQLSESFKCIDSEFGIVFETNNKVSQELFDTGIEQSIETFVNFTTDIDLFLTVLTSVLDQGISTHFEFLNLRSDDTLVYVTTSPVSPKIETVGKETIDDLHTMREIYTVKQ